MIERDRQAAVFEELGPPLTQAEIATLESEVGELPEHYRDFLLTANGGRFQDWTRYAQGQFGGLNDMYPAVPRPGIVMSVLYARQIMAERMPGDLLVIGDDQAGNLICLGLGGSRLGQVYRWDHELEHLGERALTFLAPTLDAFLLDVSVEA